MARRAARRSCARTRARRDLPRRKEGEDPNAPRHISITYDTLEGLFHLPLRKAAREIGLCPTTFKKACRRFGLEQWPFRMKQGRIALARMASQADGVDADINTPHQEPVCMPAATMLQTTGAHQVNHAVTVSCTSPVWQDGMWDTSAFSVPISPIVSASSTTTSEFPSASPQCLFQQASMVIDTRSYGEASHDEPAFEDKTFASLDAPSYIDTLTRGSIVIGVSTPCPSPVWNDGSCAPSSCNVIASSELDRDCATPLKTGPPRERSCVEAVMDCLDLGCYISEADVESIFSDDYQLQCRV